MQTTKTETTEEATETTEAEEKTTRTMDPELLAMGRILRTLADLDPHAKRQVVAWVWDKHIDHPTTGE